jgi:hypothetical protein
MPAKALAGSQSRTIAVADGAAIKREARRTRTYAAGAGR